MCLKYVRHLLGGHACRYQCSQRLKQKHKEEIGSNVSYKVSKKKKKNIEISNWTGNL